MATTRNMGLRKRGSNPLVKDGGPPLARVDVRPPLFPNPLEASPVINQVLGPRSVADAQNPLVRSQVAPVGQTMPPPYSEERPYGTNPPDPGKVYEPGGGETPYDPLTSISTGRPYGAAGYAMPAWSPPTPPSRPSGLGGVLAGAVQPASAIPRTATALAPAGQPQSSAFTGIDRQNSGPNDRFRGGGTALNLSGLLGGLFGGGGPAPNPAPPPPPARTAVAAGARGRQAPDMSGVAFDENGNPIPDYGPPGPGLQAQDPTQLAGTVGKPGWWKPLR